MKSFDRQLGAIRRIPYYEKQRFENRRIKGKSCSPTEES